MTASARSPRARWASAATSEESTPPESATTTLPSSRRRSSTRSWRVHAPASAAASAAAQTLLTGRPSAAAARAQSSCSGARFTTSPSSRPSLTRTLWPSTVTSRKRRSSSQPLVARHAHAERRRLAHDRLGHGTRVVGPRQRREHDAGPPLLHLHRRRPDVERAGGERARGGVGHELARRVVEVRLDHDHLAARPRGLAQLADEDAHDVRHLRGVARPGAVADRSRAPSAGIEP